MLTPSLAPMLFRLLAVAGGSDLQMPPPPAGMKVLAPAERQQLLGKAEHTPGAASNQVVPNTLKEDAEDPAATHAVVTPALAAPAPAKTPAASATTTPTGSATTAPTAASTPGSAPAAQIATAQAATAPADKADDDDDSDSADDAPEADEQATELEEMRALENVEINPTPATQSTAKTLQIVQRLGLGNPLRHRLLDAFEEPMLREDAAPAELPRITDLAQFDVGVVKDEYDIPVEMQPLVAQYIQFFQHSGRKWFKHWMNRSTRFIPVMTPILEKNGVPKDTVYLAMIESGFSTEARSWAHAVGPWQFISGTGKMFGLKQDFWVDERRDPIKATVAASRYLNQLHEDLGDWRLAWAAYNTGSGRVHRVMKKKGSDDFWVISDGKGLAKETKHYVPKLIACALVAKHPKAFGFADDEFDYLPALDYDEVKVVAPTDIEVLARAAGTTGQVIKELNPELKRWCTPPASEEKPYLLRIPKGQAPVFAENFAKLPPQERLTFKVHKVSRGDTLSVIAARYHSAPEAIMQLNRLKNVRALKINTELAIPVPSARAEREGKAEAVLEKQVAKARRNGFTAVRPEEEVPAGTMKRALALGPIKTEQVGNKTRITYGVQSGDSLWTIAQRFNVSVDELRRWNGLGRRTRGLQIGTVLEIWSAPGTTVANPVGDAPGTLVALQKVAPAVTSSTGTTVVTSAVAGKKTHTLERGETLWSIAQQYGVTVEELKKWNGITDHRAIKAGAVIAVGAP